MNAHLVSCSFEECYYFGTQKQVATHYLWKHCTAKTVPYACKGCGYRALTRTAIQIHRREKHGPNAYKEDLHDVCDGTFETSKFPRMFKKPGVTTSLTYDAIPKRELITNDDHVPRKDRNAIANNKRYRTLSLPPLPHSRNSQCKTEPPDVSEIHTSRSSTRPTNNTEGRAQTRSRDRQAWTRYITEQAQTRPRGRQAQACPAREPTSTCHASQNTLEPPRKKIRSELPYPLKRPPQKLHNLALDKIVDEAGHRIDLVPHELFILPEPNKDEVRGKRATSKGSIKDILPLSSNTADCVPVTGAQTENKQTENKQKETSSATAPPACGSESPKSCLGNDELAEPEALPPHVNYLLGLEEDGDMTGRSDEEIGGNSRDEGGPATGNQAEIGPAINQQCPDKELSAVTKTMEELVLVSQSQEKQNAPIGSGAAQNVMTSPSPSNSKDANSDLDTSEVHVSAESEAEKMPLISNGVKGLSAKMKSSKKITLQDEQMAAYVKAMEKLNEGIMSLRNSIEKLIPLMEQQIPLAASQITWVQQSVTLMETQLQAQRAATQAQQSAFDTMGIPPGGNK